MTTAKLWIHGALHIGKTTILDKNGSNDRRGQGAKSGFPARLGETDVPSWTPNPMFMVDQICRWNLCL